MGVFVCEREKNCDERHTHIHFFLKKEIDLFAAVSLVRLGEEWMLECVFGADTFVWIDRQQFCK